MIEQFLKVLQEKGFLLKDEEMLTLSEAQSLLRDEDIADALWLASWMGESTIDQPEDVVDEKKEDQRPKTIIEAVDGTIPAQPLPPVVPAFMQDAGNRVKSDDGDIAETGLPLQVQTAPALPNSIEMGRSLRPFMRKVASRTQQVLDETATVDRIAREDIWIPVLQSARERWLDLELVIEASYFSFLWESTLEEFQQLLETQGAFRNVRTWVVDGFETGQPRLYPKTKSKLDVLSSASVQEASATPLSRSPRELIDASGRALVIYVSDCRSKLWQSGEIHRWLKLWSLHGPTTVAQLLPERLWAQTELRLGFKVQVSAFTPGVANPKLQVHNAPSRRRFSDAQALTLPVVSLTANSLKQWARVVSAMGQQRLPGRLFDVYWEQGQAKKRSGADWNVIDPQTPEARIELFNATASAPAKRLARLMSVVPVELPVVHLLQQAFFKGEAEPVHIAEVYDSCLLERKASADGTDEIRYDFVAGVRELLNPTNRVDETLDVLDVISQEIARTLGFEINSFTALLSPTLDVDEEQKAAVLPFAQIATQVLRRLGGQYAELAQQVEQETAQHEEWERYSNFEIPELRTIEFFKAELIDAEDEPDPALNLILDEFEIATIVVEQDDYEIFEFVEAKLVRRQAETEQSQGFLRRLFRRDADVEQDAGTESQWVIQRQNRTAYRFVEKLESIDLEMVSVSGGTFTMGSPATEPERNDREGPQHEVTVPSFFMGRYPITQTQWRFVAGLEQVERSLEPDPSRFKGDNRPVERVSWHEAVEFCKRLSRYTRNEYRLPTEAEWEYACRAGTDTPFHFGETISSELANYRGDRVYNDGPEGDYRKKTTPVNHFEVANAFGLSDMHGNVFEWCQDYFHDSYQGAPGDGSVWNEGGNERRRIRRGGSWGSYPRDCRSAYRGDFRPDVRISYIGFRVVSAAPRTLER